MPRTLEEVVSGDQSGFELRFCYYLQVKHNCMGFFPGIITDTNECILVLDKDLINPIWASMPPKSSEVIKGLFFVSKEAGVAFSMSSGNLNELFSLHPWSLLSREKFEQLTINGNRPFSWALGIHGAIIQPAEFERLRERELAKLAL